MMPAETASWTDIAQASAALVGLAVALGLGIVQFRVARRADRRAVDAYMTSSIAAAERAEVVLSEIDVSLGGMQDISRIQLQMHPAIHVLQATEGTLASIPLHQAPSGRTAGALIGLLQEVRSTRGSFEAFLASNHDVMRVDLSDRVREVERAARDLRLEHKRLSPPTVVMGLHELASRRAEARELGRLQREVRKREASSEKR